VPEQQGERTQYTIRPEENSPELVYTAITRCKENLFIINCGNERYHEFFNNFSV
jgi:superfamily I DNA/RNA helicase